MEPSGGAGNGPSPTRWEALGLGAMAVAYGCLHHLGSLGSGLGAAGPTRWTDWLDLATPYAVLVPAGVALVAAGTRAGVLLGFLAGAVTYADGHGIHLAANSIGNAAPGEAAHLWDEVVGHYLWHAGWFAVLAALTACFARRTLPRGVIPYLLALLVGITIGTNALEGGTVALALAGAVGFGVAGWRTRHGLGRLLLVAFAPTCVVILGYGLLHGGFPQPSDLSG